MMRIHSPVKIIFTSLSFVFSVVSICMEVMSVCSKLEFYRNHPKKKVLLLIRFSFGIFSLIDWRFWLLLKWTFWCQVQFEEELWKALFMANFKRNLFLVLRKRFYDVLEVSNIDNIIKIQIDVGRIIKFYGFIIISNPTTYKMFCHKNLVLKSLYILR